MHAFRNLFLSRVYQLTFVYLLDSKTLKSVKGIGMAKLRCIEGLGPARLKKKNCTGLLLLLECTFVWNRNIFFGMPKEHKQFI